MIVTAKQIFSIVDGRLSTKMDDIYTMLNEAVGRSLQTIELPGAMELVKSKNPPWFVQAKRDLDIVKEEVGDDFNDLMDYYDKNLSDKYYEIYNIYDVKKIRNAKLKKLKK